MIERISIIMLVNLLFFLKTIGYKYVSDDIPTQLSQKKYDKFLDQFMNKLVGRYKTTPQEDHFLTSVLHGLVCIFIYLAFGANDISYLAAFLYMFNPINNQGSVWISGRSYVLTTLFMLITIAWPLIGPFSLFACTYFTFGFIPPLILLGTKAWWLIFIMPAIWFYRYKTFKVSIMQKVNTEMFAEDKKVHWRKLVLGAKTFGFYLSHSLIPTKTTFYHSFLQSAAGSMKHKAYTMKDRYFWIGLMSIITIFWYWISHPWDTISLGLLWWCICIGPHCNLMRISQEIAERYAYLPNVGLMLVLSVLLQGHPLLITGFVMMYATRLWFYMDAYQDDYFLVEHACMNSPNSWFAWHVRAMTRWNAQSYQEAMILWTMALKISPKEFKLHLNLATVLMLAKHPEEAVKHLKLAEENIPGGQEVAAKAIIDDFKQGKCSVLL